MSEYKKGQQPKPQSRPQPRPFDESVNVPPARFEKPAPPTKTGK